MAHQNNIDLDEVEEERKEWLEAMKSLYRKAADKNVTGDLVSISHEMIVNGHAQELNRLEREYKFYNK